MSNICFKKVTSEFKEIEVIVYEIGKFHKPLLILGTVDVENLKKELK